MFEDACHTFVPGRSSSRHSPSIWSLCVSDNHALYVLALHGVAPRLAVRLHVSSSEERFHP